MTKKKVAIQFIDEDILSVVHKCDYLTVVGNVLALTFDDKVSGFKVVSYPLVNILRYDCEYVEEE